MEMFMCSISFQSGPLTGWDAMCDATHDRPQATYSGLTPEHSNVQLRNDLAASLLWHLVPSSLLHYAQAAAEAEVEHVPVCMRRGPS